MTACIVHYNTPELTTAAIRSLWKHHSNCRVVIFDNSDLHPFALDERNRLNSQCSIVNAQWSMVNVIDNTQGQMIDFHRWLASFRDKQPINNAYASAKHCYTVQWLIDYLGEPFLLMDSDVLIRQDVTHLFDDRYAYVGEEKMHKSRFGNVMRVLPFLCYINVPVIRDHGITFYHPRKMYALSSVRPDNAYDTGCWFYEDCHAHRVSVRNISIEPYALHFGHGSWKEKDSAAWLKSHQSLYS